MNRHLFHDTLTNGDTNPFTKRLSTNYRLTFRATQLRHFGRSIRCGPTRLRIRFFSQSLVPTWISSTTSRVKSTLTFESLRPSYSQGCDLVFEHILHDFNNFCPQRTINTSGNTKSRAALGKVVEEAKATLEGPVKMRLLECGLNRD